MARSRSVTVLVTIASVIAVVTWTISGSDYTTASASSPPSPAGINTKPPGGASPEGVIGNLKWNLVWMSDIVMRSVVWGASELLAAVTVWNSLAAVAGVVTLYYGHKIFFQPLNRVRLLGDCGYIPEGRLSKRDLVNQVRKRRLVGDVPPVYPNGWFSIMESRDLKVKEAKSVSYLGKNFAVFRGEDGTAHIIDAYCPHLGANLAAGGRVFGNCIECPFHGWRFRGEDGKCTSIPYADKIPDVAKVASYISLERNGFIYYWHHAEGAEPTWFPPVIEELEKGEYVYRGRTEHHLNCHIQEVPENGADIAHLAQVHSPFLLSSAHLKEMWHGFWSFIRHDWSGTWSVLDPAEPHIGALQLTHKIRLFGYRVSFLDTDVIARQIGPGIVYMHYKSTLGSGAYLHNITPTAPLDQKIVHHIVHTWWIPAFIAKFVMISEALMIERDFMIWVNKRYQAKPVLVKCAEDTILSKHRRWYSQFYTENSPKLSFSDGNSLEW